MVQSSFTGNRDLIRAINNSLILNEIKNRGPIPRAELARITGLSPATVTSIVSDLIEARLVFEKEPGNSSGGRRPILLSLNPRGGYVVGLKISYDQVVGALTDLQAELLTRMEVPLTTKDPTGVVRILAEMVDGLVSQSGISRSALLGVGVGMAGIVDSNQGLLRWSPFFGWRDLPLRDILQMQVGVPVYIDNNEKSLALAEKWFGTGRLYNNFLVVAIGNGVGMGIVVNGQYYNGAHGGAGEVGHTLIDPDGPPCMCGKQGCVEAYLANYALLREANLAFQHDELSQTIQSTAQLYRLAELGDPTVVSILKRAGKTLGRVLANLINIFNPQCIILTGDAMQFSAWQMPEVHQMIEKYSMPNLREGVNITIEPWDNALWARGAASLVLRRLFNPPIT